MDTTSTKVPTEDQIFIRAAERWYSKALGGKRLFLRQREFKKGLAAHDAQVAADAWDEGRAQAIADWDYDGLDHSDNPYRTAAE